MVKNKVKPKKNYTPMNRGSPRMVAVISTANVTSSPARRAAGAPEEDIPGSRLLGPHSRDRPL
jgi:hypothetical protein